MNNMKIIAQNKKAFFDYQMIETFEAGISLLGHEVKAVKTGRISILGSYVMLRGEEVFLVGANIYPYQPANIPASYNPKRDRKLLLRKNEIKKLLGKKKELGLTLVPLKVYTKERLVKIEIALAKGKKQFDKREVIKKREAERAMRKQII